MTKNKLTTTPKRILIMAAGTGGHVFPALAVARQLQAQGHTVHWLGTPHGMENRLLAKYSDIPMHHVAIKGMRGNGVLRLLATPFKLMAATLAAVKIIKAQKIDVVAGFGGYVAAPGGLAAKLAGVPLVIHEQNAIAGMTNTYLAKIATTVLEAFPSTFATSAKVHTVGNPIRDGIVQLGKEKLGKENLQAQSQPAENAPASTYKLLVIGGSLGAQVLNENVPKALALLPMPVSILHQCGRGHLEKTQAAYAAENLAQHQYEVTEFVDDMAAAYASTDVLICRAGASTVSEVAVAGVPAVFVPLPHAVDDHQTANAKFLSADGSARLLPQSALTAESLANTIKDITEQGVLASMRKNTIAKGLPQATDLAVNAILAALK